MSQYDFDYHSTVAWYYGSTDTLAVRRTRKGTVNSVVFVLVL